jgi:hypothetical protein
MHCIKQAAPLFSVSMNVDFSLFEIFFDNLFSVLEVSVQ